MEIWKDITGYKSLYQVSNLGRVRRLTRKVKHKNGHLYLVRGRVLKLMRTSLGYDLVMVHKNNVSKRFSVHRLVLMTFCPNSNKKLVGNHLNGIRYDNRLVNLEWCTPSENVLHSYKSGRKIGKRGESSHLSRLTTEIVLKIIETYKSGLYSQQEVADMFGIKQPTVQNICSGKRWGHLNAISTVQMREKITNS